MSSMIQAHSTSLPKIKGVDSAKVLVILLSLRCYVQETGQGGQRHPGREEQSVYIYR